MHKNLSSHLSVSFALLVHSQDSLQFLRDSEYDVSIMLYRVELKLQPPSRNQEAALQEALNLVKLFQGIFHPSSKEMARVRLSVIPSCLLEVYKRLVMMTNFTTLHCLS